MREAEITVRTALGASRSRIVGHVLGEAAVLGVLGGAAGLLVARMLVSALLAIGPADLPRVAEIGIGWSAAGFTLLAALGATSSTTRAGGAMAGMSQRAPGGERGPCGDVARARSGVRGSRARRYC
jgi:ABC-type antimicrobial peptide transport system permease subunit